MTPRFIAITAALTLTVVRPFAQQPAPPQGNAANGKALYETNKCRDCHRIGERGSRLGPDLTGAAELRTPDQLHRAIVAPDDNYSTISRWAEVPPWKPGTKYTGRAPNPGGRGGGGRGAGVACRTEAEGYGAVRAIDPKTGEKKWDFKMVDYTESGVLTTASDVLFSGGREGHFFALDARNGELLWRVNLGGTVSSGPMTYSVNGKQYVAVCADGGLFVFSLAD